MQATICSPTARYPEAGKIQKRAAVRYIGFNDSAPARVAKLADARDLKSRVSKETYRFNSGPGHHSILALRGHLVLSRSSVGSVFGVVFGNDGRNYVRRFTLAFFELGHSLADVRLAEEFERNCRELRLKLQRG